MRVVQHATSNGVLAAPAGQTIEECRPAPITRTTYEDGTPTVTTYWELTLEERIALTSGARIRVEVVGVTMPPMLVTVATP